MTKNLFKTQNFLSLATILTIGLSAGAASARTYIGQTDWIVSGFGQGETSGEAFCAMAKGYSSDTILTFARNAGGDSSIAVESEGLSLNADDVYAVTLQAGRSYLSSFDVKPVSQRAFVLKLGGDEALFRALKENKRLKLTVASEEFELPLGSFDGGYGELETCLAKTKSTYTPSLASNATRKGDVPQFLPYDAEPVTTEELARPPQRQTKAQPIINEKEAMATTAPSKEMENDIVNRPRVSARENRLAGNVTGGSSLPEYDKSYQYKTQPYKPANVPAVESVAPLSLTPIQHTAPSAISGEVNAYGSELSRLREENIKLARLLEGERRKFENASLETVDSNVMRDLTERLEITQKENRILRSKIEADEGGREFLDMASMLAKMQTREKNLLVQIQEQKDLVERADAAMRNEKSLMQALETERAKAKAAETRLAQILGANGVTERGEVQAMYQEIEQLRQRERTLESQLAQVQTTRVANTDYTGRAGQAITDAASLNEMQRLRLENAELRKTITKLGHSGGATPTNLNEASKAYVATIEKLQSRIARLEADNAHLRQNGGVGAENAAAIAELHKLKKRYEQSELENERLGRLLTQARERGAQPQQLAAVSAPQTPVSKISKADKALTPAVTAPQMITSRVSKAANEQSKDKVLMSLQRASIPVTSSIDRLANVSRPGFAVYQWDSNDVYGTVEVTQASGAQVLDTLHNAYIEKTRRRCQGDFEAIPVSVMGTNMAAYDVACVNGPNGNAVASLYFIYDGSDFMTYAFETTIDDFSSAMSLRDRLAGVRG
ncbi:MAG: hypothetical protein CMH32_03120 [Micavibrio sp.]|nr:hypothetical protein [Micavibrio sp.]HCK33286.1 hypothetical protein [Rhodospirillaceae bacterium]